MLYELIGIVSLDTRLNQGGWLGKLPTGGERKGFALRWTGRWVSEDRARDAEEPRRDFSGFFGRYLLTNLGEQVRPGNVAEVKEYVLPT